MRILVLGSGGREHAIYLKLKSEAGNQRVFQLPGNGGTDPQDKLDGTLNDFTSIARQIRALKIDLVFVGPEQPLAEGISEYLQKETGVAVFGPDQRAAQLEGSKVFAYQFMKKAGIPTAKSIVIENLPEGLAAIEKHSLPIVLKVDGLAAGKGVSIHRDRASAKEKLIEIFEQRIFGQAGNRVLLCEFLSGTEASLFALCNGSEAIFLPVARDYKTVFENGEGPNTGGMGSYTPGDHLTPAQIAFAHQTIVKPVLQEFSYVGILYVGLMVHSSRADDISVIEFNCRLGDPETQCVMPYLAGDLTPYLLWACGRNNPIPKVAEEGFYRVPVKAGASLNVVLAAKGYPGDYEKDIPLKLPQKMPGDVHIVHAGTARIAEGQFVSKGGRILNIVATGNDTNDCRQKVYAFMEQLKTNNDFSRLHYRKDIGL